MIFCSGAALAQTAAVAESDAPEVIRVTAGPVSALEKRAYSNSLLNEMDIGDFGKFAAGDVADALKFVPGVNVVKGQFAIIRGLEDRYNSTLYNSAPVPSPDPDSQSVQLDLFPSEVLSSLAVSKTFTPELPSNSAGGSINVVTHEYPEEFEFKLETGLGFNTNAIDRFLELERGSAMGNGASGMDTIDGEIGASIGNRFYLGEREIRAKAVFNWNTDHGGKQGFQEAREPRQAQIRSFPRPPTVVRSGDLSLGELNLTGGRFDLSESEQSERYVGYLGLGFDLDEDGDHKLDASLYYTHKREEIVQLRENGFLPGYDYSILADRQASGGEIDSNGDFDGFATPSAWIARSVRPSANDSASRGPLWYASFFESASFERKRDLLITQINGDHQLAVVEGLHVDWSANYAATSQDEVSLGVRYFYEPNDTTQIPTSFPTTPSQLGPGRYAANDGVYASDNEIEETQGFGRLDVQYERGILDDLTLKLRTGGWFEHASRSVGAEFLESPSVGGSSQFAIYGDSPESLGRAVFTTLDASADGVLSGVRNMSNESTREIGAWNLGTTVLLWDRLDLLAGLRLENISIESRNDPFTGVAALDGTPDIFPKKYLFIDRLDNPTRGEGGPAPAGTTFNDQILGIDVPIDFSTTACDAPGEVRGCVDLIDRSAIQAQIDGRIDETRFLPSAGFNYRPLEGLSLRGAYSQTAARPSFREMGYYVSVDPGSDDLVVGNPKLKLSPVESWDLRAEYTWGYLGDLFAVSGFLKTIEDPLESIVIRDPTNFEGSSSALYRTFFNNPNEAEVQGFEVEIRKSLDFVGLEVGEYFSVGGNYSFIHAEVDRTAIELARAQGFFGVAAGDVEQFSGLASSRRLFGQPAWIVNADFSLDYPDWGTKATLAFFAISDVLDAAGSATIIQDGSVQSMTLDRYVDSFHQLDLILSQTFHVELLRGDVTLKASFKNLTDSRRRILYDPEQTSGDIVERSYRVGRDFKFSVTYAF